MNLPRYILNKTWGGLRVIVHDRHYLSERCNTDAIKKRGEAKELDPKWRRCKWCCRMRRNHVLGPNHED